MVDIKRGGHLLRYRRGHEGFGFCYVFTNSFLLLSTLFGVLRTWGARWGIC